MYSKDALDMYELVLQKVASEISVKTEVKTAAKYINPKFINDFISKMWSNQKMHSILSKFPDLKKALLRGNVPSELTKGIKENFPDIVSELSLTPWKAILGTAGVAAPTAYLAGRGMTKGQDTWDKYKWGAGGLAAGLALPSIYSALGNGNLSALSSRLGMSPTENDRLGNSYFTA